MAQVDIDEVFDGIGIVLDDAERVLEVIQRLNEANENDTNERSEIYSLTNVLIFYCRAQGDYYNELHMRHIRKKTE